ncbi:extracellular basic protease [Lysobacter antibioticus]|uniref:Extracellular basic protease n=1 Tax=Lysobacter antibioticus TaxID=84531 RepID=A0A0S2DXT3_LYSAN|nr:S8 family serine peptidase [Lysobacter antibioticus]ALN63228.1 extracellular basic protease [Lysobacter antibioticus]ALN81452.1 extracellular basic protease [Lysobacter antibioticus]
MSTVSNNGIRKNVLATATVLALSALAAPAFAGQVNLDGLQAAQGYDGFIVKYRNGSVQRQDSAKVATSLSQSLRAKVAGRLIAMKHVRRLAIGSDLVRADGKLDRVDAEALMRQLAADPNVESVQVNRLWTHTMDPNDSRYGEQWHYSGVNGARVNTAWDRATGAGTVVAVVDTGIVPHAELNGNNNLLPGYDFVSDAARARDGNGRDNNPNDEGDWFGNGECGLGSQKRDSSWHGSHVAGTVAAATNNAAGVAGVAHGARIVPVRVLAKCGGSTADIADGIVWAAGGAVNGVPANANPAEVINLSLGGASAQCDAAYQDAIDKAVARGATVVVAAGNSNRDVSGFTPANCNNVVAVAATDRNGDRAFYSNYGATMDIAAPGGETCTPNVRFLALGQQPYCDVNHEEQGVLSLGNTGLTVQAAADYTFMQGTSMAAPHVAGVVALMQSAVAAPLTPAQVERALKDSSRAIAAANCPGGCGTGLIDANAAVVEAIRVAGGGGGNVNPVANFSSAVNGLTATFTDSSTDSDGSIASRSWNFGDGTAASTATNPSHTYAAAGTYNVSLTVTDNAGGTHTKTASVTVTAPGGGVQTYSNGTDYTINDNSTVESPITVSGRSGNAPSNATVTVAIVHSFRGDVRVDLVAPDGSTYLLKNYNTYDSADDIRGTVTLNLSTETLNGTWKLRARDNYVNDTGKIDSWSIKF